MGVPGSNLLKQALKVIKPTTIQYVKWNGRSLNAARQYVDSYDSPTDMRASVQAVKRSSYVSLNLDFQKDYVKIWANVDLISLDRDYSGDVFIWNSKQYKLVDDTDWDVQDGWASALAVRIRNTLDIA